MTTLTQLPTEAECQTTIVEAARLAGWLVHHGRPARTNKGWRTPIQGHPGFVDLVLARDRVIFIELKRRGNPITPDQERWLRALRRAGEDVRIIIVPDQMQTLLDELCTPPRTT